MIHNNGCCIYQRLLQKWGKWEMFYYSINYFFSSLVFLFQFVDLQQELCLVLCFNGNMEEARIIYSSKFLQFKANDCRFDSLPWKPSTLLLTVGICLIPNNVPNYSFFLPFTIHPIANSPLKATNGRNSSGLIFYLMDCQLQFLEFTSCCLRRRHLTCYADVFNENRWADSETWRFVDLMKCS